LKNVFVIILYRDLRGVLDRKKPLSFFHGCLKHTHTSYLAQIKYL
jgi:G:T-mismatch repair DNA endonuclease (very short patch repair protein)